MATNKIDKHSSEVARYAMVRRGWLIVGEPLLAIRRFSTGGPTETYRRRPMTLVGHWWADSDKPTATCRPLPPLAHQSNAIWVYANICHYMPTYMAIFATICSTPPPPQHSTQGT